MKIVGKFFVWFILATLSLQSYAYTCQGKVVGLSIDPKSGAILAERIGTLLWPRLCSVSFQLNDVSPASCKIVYSALLTAQSTNKEVIMWFNDDKNCNQNSHTPWATLTGWYFGPKIVH